MADDVKTDEIALSEPVGVATSADIVRDPSGKFVPGVSGNPRGRAKEYPEFKAACREHSDRALKVLVEALDATRVIPVGDDGDTIQIPDHKLRIMAANALHDRAWGKPAQAITGEDGKPLSMGVLILPPELMK